MRPPIVYGIQDSCIQPSRVVDGKETLLYPLPNKIDRVCRHQQKQKAEHDRGTVERNFEIGTPAFVKNFASGPAWLPGKRGNSTGILPRILGQPQTNCNKSKLNRYCFLIMFLVPEKSPKESMWA